jgi:tellurite resistance protein
VDNKTTTKRFERRKFLSAVVAAGATAAVGTACTSNKQAKSSAAPEDPQAGYQETAHVRTYYETARL